MSGNTSIKKVSIFEFFSLVPDIFSPNILSPSGGGGVCAFTYRPPKSQRLNRKTAAEMTKNDQNYFDLKSVVLVG